MVSIQKEGAGRMPAAHQDSGFKDEPALRRLRPMNLIPTQALGHPEQPDSLLSNVLIAIFLLWIKLSDDECNIVRLSTNAAEIIDFVDER